MSPSLRFISASVCSEVRAPGAWGGKRKARTMAERKSRRRFLAEGALALAGVAVAGSKEAAAAPDAGVAPPSGSASIFSGTPGAATAEAGPPLTAGTFAEAEKLMRVTLTAEQRTQAAESWDGSFGAFFERRKFKL